MAGFAKSQSLSQLFAHVYNGEDDDEELLGLAEGLSLGLMLGLGLLEDDSSDGEGDGDD